LKSHIFNEQYHDAVIRFGDSASIDAFARARVSNPNTIFESKQLHDSQVLLWDDAETSGGGTSTSHSDNKAATTISVSALTAGTRIRQTFRAFNYQAGKSQLIIMTGTCPDDGAGITKRIGYFNESNGVFFENDGGNLSFVLRSSVTGSAVDTRRFAQADWNVDRLDGTGPSGITFDSSAAQIWWYDIEWLGTGRVRCGIFYRGMPIHCCSFYNSNEDLTTAYMSSPNLPLRYEISADGTNASAGSLDHICSTVISEGGRQEVGILQHYHQGNTFTTLATGGTLYPLLGYRLKAPHFDDTVITKKVTTFCNTADDYQWLLLFNPTLSGALSFSDQTNSPIQLASGDGTVTVTNEGFVLDGDYASSGQGGQATAKVSSDVSNALIPGKNLSGTMDQVWLCVRPLGSGALNADLTAGMTLREIP
jgi:hypothetical protein